MKSAECLLSDERLTILNTTVNKLPCLTWSGECDFRNPSEVLTPVLSSFAQHLKEGPLVLDFRSLTFMNSSSVTPILSFVKGVCSRGISVRLIYNAEVSWQRITASSMRTIATVFKNLSVDMERP